MAGGLNVPSKDVLPIATSSEQAINISMSVNFIILHDNDNMAKYSSSREKMGKIISPIKALKR